MEEMVLHKITVTETRAINLAMEMQAVRMESRMHMGIHPAVAAA
jgi:hypothetical protein